MTLRVGLIGAGVMGTDHARTISTAVAGATLVAVTDTDHDRAAELGGQLGADVVPSDHDLIASSDVDAVIIASHDSAHAQQVMACVEAGKPVLCEKPLAPTVEECQQIVSAQQARALGDLVSVGFMRRFHAGFRAMKDALATEALGSPLMVVGSHRNVRAYPTGGSEGTLTNSAVHDIDITEWLLGSPIVEVGWYAPKPTSLDPERHDPQLIHLRTAEGVLASIDVFVNAQYGYDVRRLTLPGPGDRHSHVSDTVSDTKGVNCELRMAEQPGGTGERRHSGCRRRDRAESRRRGRRGGHAHWSERRGRPGPG